MDVKVKGCRVRTNSDFNPAEGHIPYHTEGTIDTNVDEYYCCWVKFDHGVRAEFHVDNLEYVGPPPPDLAEFASYYDAITSQ